MHHDDLYILTPESVLSKAIIAQPILLQVVNRFGLKLGLGSASVQEICDENNINLNVFICVSNLYTNQHLEEDLSSFIDGLPAMIEYLSNSHHEFLDEKYPEIKHQIKLLSQLNSEKGVLMVDKFFDEYFQEVRDHLAYENEVVFPHVLSMVKNEEIVQDEFSVSVYKDKHDDIEEKLNDLKNLLIKYLPVQQDGKVRIELLRMLNDLEKELHIHSEIEEGLFMPTVEILEKSLAQ